MQLKLNINNINFMPTLLTESKRSCLTKYFKKTLMIPNISPSFNVDNDQSIYL